jgi:hypothetical protein
MSPEHSCNRGGRKEYVGKFSDMSRNFRHLLPRFWARSSSEGAVSIHISQEKIVYGFRWPDRRCSNYQPPSRQRRLQSWAHCTESSDVSLRIRTVCNSAQGQLMRARACPGVRQPLHLLHEWPTNTYKFQPNKRRKPGATNGNPAFEELVNRLRLLFVTPTDTRMMPQAVNPLCVVRSKHICAMSCHTGAL